ELQVVAAAGEDLVRLDVDGDEEVAGGLAAFARGTLPCQADLLPVDHAGWDADGDGAGTVLLAGAGAVRARVLDAGAGAGAVRARGRDAGAGAGAVRARPGEAKGAPVLGDEPVAATGPAGARAGAGLRAGAVAVGTGGRAGEPDGHGHALGGFPEFEGDLGF